jgi:hypothetical protein
MGTEPFCQMGTRRPFFCRILRVTLQIIITKNKTKTFTNEPQ